MNAHSKVLNRRVFEYYSKFKDLRNNKGKKVQAYKSPALEVPKYYARAIDSFILLKDFYATLGIQKGCSDEDIKKAYRKKTLENHPDRNPNDKEAVARFQEINKAYEVLKDKDKRAMYDQVGAENYEQFAQGGGGQQGGARNPFEQGFGGFGFSDFPGGFSMRYEFDERGFGSGNQGGMGSLFEELIKQAMGQQSINITVSARIGFMEAIKGAKKRLDYTTGTRSNPIKKVIDLDIPAGVATGHELRVKSQGRQIQGQKGDLIVQIEVERHPYFERRLNDIHSDIVVSFAQATLGSNLDVETVQGTSNIKIPAGVYTYDSPNFTSMWYLNQVLYSISRVQFGQLIQVKGKGAPILGTQRFGDHILHIQIQIPKDLNEQQIKLLQEFDEEEKKKHQKRRSWW